MKKQFIKHVTEACNMENERKLREAMEVKEKCKRFKLNPMEVKKT